MSETQAAPQLTTRYLRNDDEDKEQTKALLAEWISKEPSHAHLADFYYEPGTTSVLYYDNDGPVFVCRLSTAVRADIDFNPAASSQRVREMFYREFPSVAEQAKNSGFKELLFNSVSQSLIKFFEAFGFEPDPNTFRKLLR